MNDDKYLRTVKDLEKVGRNMDEINDIYDAIAADGFSGRTLQMIDNFTNDIQYGRKDFVGFTLSEHAGLCKEARLSLGRSSLWATREEALRQVAMLKAAKEAAQPIGR